MGLLVKYKFFIGMHHFLIFAVNVDIHTTDPHKLSAKQHSVYLLYLSFYHPVQVFEFSNILKSIAHVYGSVVCSKAMIINEANLYLHGPWFIVIQKNHEMLKYNWFLWRPISTITCYIQPWWLQFFFFFFCMRF